MNPGLTLREAAGDYEREPARHDVRLLIGALAAWVAAAFALQGGVGRALVIAGGAAGVGLAALALHQRGRALGSVLALAAFSVVLVVGPLAARLTVVQGSRLAALATARTVVSADVTLTGDPHLLAAKGAAGSARAIVNANVNSVIIAGRRVDAHGAVVILGPAGLWQDALPGQRLLIDATVQPALVQCVRRCGLPAAGCRPMLAACCLALSMATPPISIRFSPSVFRLPASPTSSPFRVPIVRS
jgi:hypothetical protein